MRIKLLNFFCFFLCNASSLMGTIEQSESFLTYSPNKFNVIMVDILEKPENFEEWLKNSLIQWQHEGKRAVWLTLLIQHSELIPIAVQLGFIYHHTKTRKLVMTKWLSQEKYALPSYATRTVGVWALVIDENNRILVVKEKYDAEWGYKFPSGAVEEGEDIKDGAVRETKEETGIDAVFEGIVAWTERHNTRMDNVSDLSFICLLRPLHGDVKLQESEITETVWLPYEEFKKIAQGPQKQVLLPMR